MRTAYSFLSTLLLFYAFSVSLFETSLTLAGPETSQTQEKAEQELSHLERAEKLARAGQYSEAIPEYKLVLQQDPQSVAAFFGLALAQSHLGMTEEAIQSYQTVLQLEPELWEAEINLGLLFMNQQSFPEALSHFQKSQDLNPNDFRAHYYAGKAQELMGNSSEAESSFLRAIGLAKRDSDKFETHASLGSFYLKQKNLPEAEKHLLCARKYNEQPGSLDIEMAQLYYEMGQMEKALELLQAVSTSHPEDPEVLEIMGRVLLSKKDYQAAIRSLEQAFKTQTNPSRREDLSLQLAEAHQHLGQTKRAIAFLREIVGTSANSDLHLKLGALYLHLRDYESAKLAFLKALQLKPDCAECFGNLGSVFLLQEKYPEAIGALSRFKDLKPDIPGTYFYLAISYDKLDDHQNAWSHYKKFLDLDQGKADKQGFQARERMKVLEKKLKTR